MKSYKVTYRRRNSSLTRTSYHRPPLKLTDKEARLCLIIAYNRRYLRVLKIEVVNEVRNP